jgi:hypothetical protein
LQRLQISDDVVDIGGIGEAAIGHAIAGCPLDGRVTAALKHRCNLLGQSRAIELPER